MPESFIPTANISSAVKSILDHYPLVDGPIRELLQNSDDAKATKQVFIIDRRKHPVSSIVSDEYVASQQSPALVAYNDGYFELRDWESLKSLFESNKVHDPAAFGQFGQGFRCVYHLTDCPQIFSGTTLALLSLPEGKILNTTNTSDARLKSHFSVFEGLPKVPCYIPHSTREYDKGKCEQDSPRLDGTAIRLPLRSCPSSLSINSPKPEDMLKLFDQFIRYDLECVLLFLNHVKKIEVYEVTDKMVREICSAVLSDRESVTVKRGKSEESAESVVREAYSTWRAIGQTRVYPEPLSTSRYNSTVTAGSPANTPTVKITTTIWRFIDCPFEDQNSHRIMKQRLSREYSPKEEMKRRKLFPRIRLAAPLSSVISSTSLGFVCQTDPSLSQQTSDLGGYGVHFWRDGRVFSGLPLPRANNKNWPIHVDARFAIPPSRQWIRSLHEGGFIGEWNSLLFSAFIPKAWTVLLDVLACQDLVRDIYEYWPPPGTMDNYIAPASESGTDSKLIIIDPSALSVGGSKLPGTITARSRGMLQAVFDLVIEAKAPVWPIYVTSGQSPLSVLPSKLSSSLPGPLNASVVLVPLEFAELGGLKVAREDAHFPDLRNTLAECGIRFTKPPLHFGDLIKECTHQTFQFLDPALVHEDLLENISRVEQLVSEADKHAGIILDFLLGGQDIQLLVGLPLLKNVQGHHIALERLERGDSSLAAKQTLHCMFDAHTVYLFKEYDANAISLLGVKSKHWSLIRERAPGTLNVVEITAEKVAEYLSNDTSFTAPIPSPAVSSPIPAPVAKWLSRFYTWLVRWSSAEQFLRLQQVRTMFLIPTQLGLRRVKDGIFDTRGVTPALGKCLQALSISLLDYSVGQSTKKLLVDVGGILQNVEDIRALLDGARVAPRTPSIIDLSPTSLGLACSEWKTLIDHIVHYTDTEDLNLEDRKKLRSLPIYPILRLDSTGLVTTPGVIPENHSVYAVTRIDILPIIDACIFLDFRTWSSKSYEILRLVDPRHPVPLTPTTAFELGVLNFESQTPELQSSIIKYAAKNQRSLPRESLDKLLDTPSIMCKDGINRKPGDVFSPQSGPNLSDIVAACMSLDISLTNFDEYWPRLDSQNNERIISEFQKFSFSPFREHLDQMLLLKIVTCISSDVDCPRSIDISKKLFDVLGSNPSYGSFIKNIPSETRWIATNSGLRAQHECRDHSPHSDLLDEVYAIVPDDVIVPDTLKSLLGWSEEISPDVIVSQLDATLKKGGNFKRVRNIIQKIAAMHIPVAELTERIGDRPWVPTKSGRLVTPENAVLGDAIEDAGLSEVSFNEKAYPEVVDLLRRMGVQERPTTSMILARLQTNVHETLTDSQIISVIRLLERLPFNLSAEEKARVLVPNVEGRMMKVVQLYLNDTGVSIDLQDLTRRGRSIAHNIVSERIAQNLGIEPLVNLYSDFVSGYMGESFISSIRNTIVDYSEAQMLTEMLANAVDAGAKRFLVVIDNMPQSTSHLISSKLVKFQECPAVLVYNDAQFTELDFRGLCETGEGSKKNNLYSIGQFGRGALTMFHLTEFPTLVSSDTVMFIDPTTQHLCNLPRNANNQRIQMEMLKKLYPGHLSFLETLSNILQFNESDIKSFGTVFRLPLRTLEHINHNSPISRTIWSAKAVEEIVDAFKRKARDCLLFTGLERIEAYVRSHEGALDPMWSFEAQCEGVESIRDFKQSSVQITPHGSDKQLWQTVSYTVPDDVLPEFALSLTKMYGRRMKQPKVSLGAFIRPPGVDYQDCHERSVFFSTLPLPEVTGLPIYCSGTFFMTSDRRHLRLDQENDTGHQAQFNVWLMKEIIPPTYLYLLGLLLETGVPNQRFWPIDDRLPADRILIDSLYKDFLKKTNSHLFQSAFDPEHHLTPGEVVILNADSSIRPIIEFLSPSNVAIYSEPFFSLVQDEAQLPQLSPRFVKELILRDRGYFLQAFTSADEGEPQHLTFDDLTNLLHFFLIHDPDQLIGLPLLPLEDNSFGLIESTRSSSNQDVFYIWRNHSIPNNIFASSNRLVDLDFDADGLLDKGFNIEDLRSSSLASLIEDKFPKCPSLDIAPDSENQAFIKSFWANFHHLKLEIADIDDFPLVPTLLKDRHVSLKMCKAGSVPIVPARVDELPCRCLANLGVFLVQLSSPGFPPHLTRLLNNRNLFKEFEMKDLLSGLYNIEPTRLNHAFFNRLTEDERMVFSDWTRRQLFFDVPDDLRDAARALPVWKAHDSDEGLDEYVPASELILLPETLDANIVAPYMRNQKIAVIPQGQTDILRYNLKQRLDVPEISSRQLLRTIASGLPTSMPDLAERLSYKTLVEAVLERTEPHDDLEELRLPNASDFTLCPIREFYSREEPLFRASFPGSSSRFLPPEFQDVEHRSMHLKRMEDITMEIFAECVECISRNSNEDGARIAFDIMNDRLPVILGNSGSGAELWEMVEDLNFVPGKNGPLERCGFGKSLLDVSHFIERRFDTLVKPQDIVRAEYVAVAWSQRALPERNLNEGLIRAHMTLGRPTVPEVIAHLRVLVEDVAHAHPNHPAVLSDLIATYEYLNDSLRFEGSAATQLTGKCFFLNVDDPQEDGVEWVWNSANRISFDMRDVGGFRSARRLLQRFRPLLLAAGAQEVSHPFPFRSSSVSPGSDSLSRVREKFSQMRQERHLVDIQFIPYDDEPDSPLLGHKSFLATQSNHLMKVFCNDLRETDPAPLKDKISCHNHSRACISLVLDYIYAGSLSKLDPSSLELPVLLDALVLGKRWEMEEFIEEVQDCIIQDWLHPGTLIQVENVAVRRDFAKLVDACAIYRRENAEYIEGAFVWADD